MKSIEDLGKNEGLFALFDPKNEFANDWYRSGKGQPLTMSNLKDRLPFFTKSR